MVDEPESATIRLLQELRAELADMRGEMSEMRDDLTNRIDGNTIILNMVAGVVHDHEQRITKLGAKP